MNELLEAYCMLRL